MNAYFYPAKIIRYNPQQRTAQISITGLTDGEPDGLTAFLAYPIGDDDRDTERLLHAGADVWVFFEQGDMASPIIAFYRSHTTDVVVDIRRIRQANIELLARNQIKLNANDVIIDANVTITGEVKVNGGVSATGLIQSDNDVRTSRISLNNHRHGGVRGGDGTTSSSLP